MCRAALQSPRKSIIFEPYPSIVDPLNPKTLAFSPKVSPRLISSTAQAPRDLLFSLWNVDAVWQVQNYERLQKTLHNILLIKTTGQVPFCIIYSQINGSFGNLRAGQTVLDGWRWLFFFLKHSGPSLWNQEADGQERSSGSSLINVVSGSTWTSELCTSATVSKTQALCLQQDFIQQQITHCQAFTEPGTAESDALGTEVPH